MKRRNLPVRAVGQKLSQAWEQKMSAFKRFTGENIQGIELHQIGTMDEVPMSFDMSSNSTIDKNGIKNIKIARTGYMKCNFTVVLCMAAGVIIKRKLYLRVISQT